MNSKQRLQEIFRSGFAIFGLKVYIHFFDIFFKEVPEAPCMKHVTYMHLGNANQKPTRKTGLPPLCRVGMTN